MEEKIIEALKKLVLNPKLRIKKLMVHPKILDYLWEREVKKYFSSNLIPSPLLITGKFYGIPITRDASIKETEVRVFIGSNRDTFSLES